LGQTQQRESRLGIPSGELLDPRPDSGRLAGPYPAAAP
jgi:hypothetical protein